MAKENDNRLLDEIMNEKKLYDNKLLFMAYGLVNIVLVVFLLVLLILIFNDIYILGRIGFVVFVGIHIALIFFIRIHYVCVYFDSQRRKVEIHFNRKFGLKWLQKSTTVLLPFDQFDGYKITADSMGLPTISFYKNKDKDRYELGPFSVGFVSNKEKKQLTAALGEPK
jgi:hypothetical protein